jgi:hypothetical protein
MTKREDWLRDVCRTTTQCCFPDTAQNEARFWRNLISGKHHPTAAQVLFLVRSAFFAEPNLKWFVDSPNRDARSLEPRDILSLLYCPLAGRIVSTAALSFVLVAAVIVGLTSCGGNKADCVLPPSISSLSPNAMTAGGPQFTLSVKGDNFFLSSVLRWNGANRQTTVLSSTQLTAVIRASDIANPGTTEIKVTTPFVSSPPNQNQLSLCSGDSNSVPFTINP